MCNTVVAGRQRKSDDRFKATLCMCIVNAVKAVNRYYLFKCFAMHFLKKEGRMNSTY
jgi:hypothetical protein